MPPVIMFLASPLVPTAVCTGATVALWLAALAPEPLLAKALLPPLPPLPPLLQAWWRRTWRRRHIRLRVGSSVESSLSSSIRLSSYMVGVLSENQPQRRQSACPVCQGPKAGNRVTTKRGTAGARVSSRRARSRAGEHPSAEWQKRPAVVVGYHAAALL